MSPKVGSEAVSTLLPFLEKLSCSADAVAKLEPNTPEEKESDRLSEYSLDMGPSVPNTMNEPYCGELTIDTQTHLARLDNSPSWSNSCCSRSRPRTSTL